MSISRSTNASIPPHFANHSSAPQHFLDQSAWNVAKAVHEKTADFGGSVAASPLRNTTHKVAKVVEKILYALGYALFTVVAIPIVLGALAAKGIRHLWIGQPQRVIPQSTAVDTESDSEDDFTVPFGLGGNITREQALSIARAFNGANEQQGDSSTVSHVAIEVKDDDENLNEAGPYPLNVQRDPFIEHIASYFMDQRTLAK